MTSPTETDHPAEGRRGKPAANRELTSHTIPRGAKASAVAGQRRFSAFLLSLD